MFCAVSMQKAAQLDFLVGGQTAESCFSRSREIMPREPGGGVGWWEEPMWPSLGNLHENLRLPHTYHLTLGKSLILGELFPSCLKSVDPIFPICLKKDYFGN